MHENVEPALKMLADAKIITLGCGCEQVGALTLQCARCTIKNVIEMALASAIAVERKRCIKAVCAGCRDGMELFDVDGDPMHEVRHGGINPDTRRPYKTVCDAWAIREMKDA